jgi:hypothetical protein
MQISKKSKSEYAVSVMSSGTIKRQDSANLRQLSLMRVESFSFVFRMTV